MAKNSTPIQQVYKEFEDLTCSIDDFCQYLIDNKDRLLKEEEDNNRELLLSFIEWSNAYDYNRNKLDSIDICNFLLQR